MKTRRLRLFSFAMVLSFGTSIQSCAVLYKVQLGDMDSGQGKRTPVCVKVSETTVDFREAADISKRVGAANNSKALKGAGDAAEMYTMLFQYGPRTGTPVYTETFAREVPERIFAECKNGYLTEIVSVRESRDYPVIKGQIVRVDATCVQL